MRLPKISGEPIFFTLIIMLQARIAIVVLSAIGVYDEYAFSRPWQNLRKK